MSATDPRSEAVASEHEIAKEAETIRGDATVLSDAMFLKLLPLLRRPIPEGFIQTIGQVKGKPYDSTGIKSVQAQIDRMDAVLTPLWWNSSVVYQDEGRLAHVVVRVQQGEGRVLCEREAWGGVDRASTAGNLYKGSYTNAAKQAFARIGPGHEVYLGVTDLDPDVNEQAAAEQAKVPGGARQDRFLTDEEKQRIREKIGDENRLKLLLAAVGVPSLELCTPSKAVELRQEMDK
jgi:hypothetical protein